MADYNESASDSTTTSELVDILLDGARNISVSDTTITSESLGFFTNPIALSISDTVTTSEKIDIIRAGARNITVFDTTTTTSEIMDLYLDARFLTISDTTVTSESNNLTTVQSPAWIIRTLTFTVIIPPSINFTLIATASSINFSLTKT